MKEVYMAEVGTPLQKALVNNFEAQKQLAEVLVKVREKAKQEGFEEAFKLNECTGEAIKKIRERIVEEITEANWIKSGKDFDVFVKSVIE